MQEPAPLTVGLETSGSLGSVAVARGGDVLARRFLDRAGRHAAELLPALAEAMDEAGVRRRDVRRVVVGGGPGSFTGVRIAAASAQALARTLPAELLAFSSLAAAAVAEWVTPPPEQGLEAARPRGDVPLWVLFDARADRLYAGGYAVTETAVEEIMPPTATRIGELLEAGEIPAGARVAGDGALRHEAPLRAAGCRVVPAPAGIPTADGLIRLAVLDPHGGRVTDPDAWEPDYLRAWQPG